MKESPRWKACFSRGSRSDPVLLRGSSARQSRSCEATEPSERTGSAELHPARPLPLPRVRIESNHSGLSHRSALFFSAILPNVKDEPRPRPARLLRPSVAHSAVSFDSAFVSRRRDGRGRWLWRLVGPFGLNQDFRQLHGINCREALCLGFSGKPPQSSQTFFDRCTHSQAGRLETRETQLSDASHAQRQR